MEKRNVTIKIRLTESELAMIQEKMMELGTDNMSAFIRKMAIDGYIVKLDLPELRELVRLLRSYSNNLNQIAVIANKTGKYDSIWLIDEITKINKLTVDLEQHFLRPVYEPLIRKGSDNLYGTNQQRL